MGGQGSFSVAQDKALPFQVLCSAWNPDKDLLAIATSEGHIAVHRLNWRRLWSVLPDAPVTALAWQPDGKILTSGHADGSLASWHVETGDVLWTNRQWHAAPVSTLSWTASLAAPGEHYKPYPDRTSRLLPPQPQPPDPPPSAVPAARPGGTHKDASLPGQGHSTPSQELRGGTGGAPEVAEAGTAAGGGGAKGKKGGAGAGAGGQSVWQLQGVVDQRRMTFLISGDKGGNVHVAAFGMFPLLAFAHLSSDLALLFVVHRGSAPQQGESALASPHPSTAGKAERRGGGGEEGEGREGGEGEGEEEDVEMGDASEGGTPRRGEGEREGQGAGVGGGSGRILTVLDTGLLLDRAAELHALVCHAVALLALTDTLRQLVLAVEHHWHTASLQWKERMHEFTDLLVSNGSAPSAEDELLLLLACGSGSSSLQQFLGSNLREQGLRRIARAMESESNLVHALLALHLLPCLEELLLRAADLRGLARTPLARFQALGLRPDRCQGALEAATLGFAKAQHMLLLVADAASQYASVFSWLGRCIQHLNEDAAPSDSSTPVNAGVVIEFLKHHCRTDPVLAQLQPGACGDARQTFSNRQLVEELASLADIKDTAAFGRSFRDQMDVLDDAVLDLLAEPSTTLSALVLKKPLVHQRLPPAGRSPGAQGGAEAPLDFLTYVDERPTPGPRGDSSGAAEQPQQQQHWPFSFAPACPLAETLLLTVKASHEGSTRGTPPGTAPSEDGRNSTVCLWAFGRRRDSGVAGVASLGEGEGESAVNVEAAEVSLEASGYSVQDCALYKGQQAALLLSPGPEGAAAEGSDGAPAPPRLVLLSPELLRFEARDPATLSLCESPSEVSSLDVGEIERSRELGSIAPSSSMSMGVNRGLLCLLQTPRRLVLLDLEDDEEGEEVEEDKEE